MEEIILNDQRLKERKIDEFRRGKRPDDTLIGFYRDVHYAIFKQEINPLAGGDVDLILTGSFTNQMRVEKVAPTRYTFNSSDSKTPMLVGKYGEDIMGINDEWWNNRQIEVYLPVFRFQVFRKANLI